MSTSTACCFDALLLDLDGTLVATDSFWIPAATAGARRAFAELELSQTPPGPDDWMSLVGLPLEEGFEQLFAQLSPGQRDVVRRHCVAEEERLLRAGGAALLPNVEATLTQLAATPMRMGIASNCGADYLEHMLGTVGLSTWIETGRSLASPGIRTKADMVQDLLHSFDTRRAVMVGDRKTDGDAAHAHGVPFVHYASGLSRVAEHVPCEARIQGFGELPELLATRSRRLEQIIDELTLGALGVRRLGIAGPPAAGKRILAEDLARALAAQGRPSSLLEPSQEPAADALAIEIGPDLLTPARRASLDRVLYLTLDEPSSLTRIASRDAPFAGPEALERASAEAWPAQHRLEAAHPPQEADMALDGANPLLLAPVEA